MTTLTPQQRNVSLHWASTTYNAVKVSSYRESRVMFNAARKLGFRATWSSNLMILWKEDGTSKTLDAGVERFLREVNRVRGMSSDEIVERRNFLRRWCPRALPAFELIATRSYA